ncbi:MAG: hypothetical protein AABY14_05040, partial [Nanoarchaeota archaeon]
MVDYIKILGWSLMAIKREIKKTVILDNNIKVIKKLYLVLITILITILGTNNVLSATDSCIDCKIEVSGNIELNPQGGEKVITFQTLMSFTAQITPKDNIYIYKGIIYRVEGETLIPEQSIEFGQGNGDFSGSQRVTAELIQGKNYKWSVEVYDTNGNKLFTQISGTFKSNTIPLGDIILTPAGGERVSTTPTLSFTANLIDPDHDTLRFIGEIVLLDVDGSGLVIETKEFGSVDDISDGSLDGKYSYTG